MHRLYERWQPNEVIRPASVGSLCILLTLYALLALVIFIAPASAINITDVHGYGVFSGPYSWGPYTFYGTNAIDGDINTAAVYMSYPAQHTSVHFVFPSDTTLTSCRFVSGNMPPPLAGQGNKSYVLDETYTTPLYPKDNSWQEYVFPSPLNVGTELVIRDSAWGDVRINETICLGYNATYNDGINIVNFTAITATSGNSPLEVSFNDTSQYKNQMQSWTFGDGYNQSGYNLQYATHVYNASGTYTVTLTAINSTTDRGTLTRTGYITVNSPGIAINTTCFQAYDGITHGALMGASLYIYDQSSNNWTNSSSDPDGLHCIDAGSDHLIDAYATKSGYSQGQIWDVYSTGDIYPINLYPSGMIGIPGDGTPGDPGVGNVNLIVNVYDKNNGNQPVDEATVTVIPPTGGQQTRLTSSAGAAIFVVPNLSTISVTATKSGYSSKSDSIITTIYGPDTLSLGLTRFVATPEPTVTGTDGVPVTTVIPGCEDPTSSTCYAARDTEMANDVRDWIEILIPIAGVMTVLYLVGWKP